MSKLDGKVAIVTGGASGIGAATVRLFVEEKAKVVIVDLNEEKGKALESELRAQKAEVHFVKANITNEDEVKNVFKEAVAKFGKVDVVFNNAGIGRTAATENLTYEDWRNTINVDLDGVFLVARESIREMLKTGGGSIINTASMFGLVGSAGSAAYNAAKGGVVNFTRSLALEYATKNIRVNSLCPGFIDTPILPVDIKDNLVSITPMQRLGKPEEMAKAVLFMACDDSSFLTGHSLTVDGGFTAR